MDINKYKGVIRMVLAESVGEKADALAEELVRSIKIAQALSGEITIAATQRPANPLHAAGSSLQNVPSGIAAVDPQALRPAPKATLISFAPPVVGANEEEPEDSDIDYWETKPGKGDGGNRLQVYLQKILPRSIKVQLPNMDREIELVCGIGTTGLKFVHVNYSIPGGEMGPRYTVMTSQKAESLDRDAILNDIMEQAAACYSATKRVVTPNAPPPSAPPSNHDLSMMMQRDRMAQPTITQEDQDIAKEFEAQRSPRWQ